MERFPYNVNKTGCFHNFQLNVFVLLAGNMHYRVYITPQSIILIKRYRFINIQLMTACVWTDGSFWKDWNAFICFISDLCLLIPLQCFHLFISLFIPAV